jgi:inorganic pyrophosphatase
MKVKAIVEIARGTSNKYEFDDNGELWLDRVLSTTTYYPLDYGYIDETLGKDGDPLDVMLLTPHPLIPGCRVMCKPVACLFIRDEKGEDEKILAVPSKCKDFSHIKDLSDVPDHIQAQIIHFFKVYKDLEPGKYTKDHKWHDKNNAEETIAQARLRRLEIKG